MGKDVKEERRCIFKMQRIFVLWLSNSKKAGRGGVSYYRYKEMTPKETESVETKGGIEQGAAPYKQK